MNVKAPTNDVMRVSQRLGRLHVSSMSAEVMKVIRRSGW